jgi:hypothetical protein
MIYLAKNDKISIALFGLCILAAVFLLSTWLYIVVSLFYNPTMTPLKARATLQRSGFTFGEPIPTNQPEIMRYPCLTPHGQICTLKYDDDGRIVEMGIMFGSNIQSESIRDIQTMIQIVAPKWNATEWTNKAVMVSGEEETVVNGYRFEISTSPILSFFVATPEDK